MDDIRNDEYNNSELYTTDYIDSLPEGERAELIDGKLYMMTHPSFVHQRIIKYMTRSISDCIDEHESVCELIISPFGLYLSSDNRNYLEPDLMVVCDRSKITDKGVVGAPDFVIEVVSPSSIQMDYMKKLMKYARSGIREYWIVDPFKKKTVIYNFETEITEEYPFTDDIPCGICPELKVNLSDFA